MKKLFLEFCRRGLVASSLGPLILVVLYLILKYQTGINTLSINQVCIGIVSLSTLSFIAGGMNVIYQIERLPLMIAILIHGIVLYVSYLLTYILNDWIEWGITPILYFTIIFVLGYIVIWIIIYFITKKNTDKLNKILEENNKFENEKSTNN